MPTAETKYYTAGSVVVAIICTVAAAAFLSLIYGPADHYSPLIYLNMLLAYGVAAATGFVGKKMIRVKKITSLGAASLIGGIGGFATLFLSWASYVWTLADFDFSVYFDHILHPRYFWHLMNFLAENPMWTIGKGSGTLPAIAYYAIWLIEAGIIIGVPIMACRNFVRDNVLCDGCGTWIAATGDAAVFDVSGEEGDAREREQRIGTGDIALLLDLPRLDPSVTGVPRMEAIGLACPYCEDKDSYVTVNFVTEKAAKKKRKPEIVRKKIVANAPVPVELEKALFEPATPPAPPISESTDTAEEARISL